MKVSIKIQSVILLVLLAIVWGSSYILMKKGLIAFSPTQIGSMRLGFTALAFLPFAWRYMKTIKSVTDWKNISIAGLCGNGIPAFLFPLAETRIDSSLAGILNALTPLFVILTGYLIYKVKVSSWQIGGVLVGLSGTVFLILLGGGQDNGQDNRFALLVILATIFYGFSSNVMKHKLQHISPLALTSAAFTLMGIPALFYLFSTDFYERLTTHPAAMMSFSCILILAVLGTFLSNIFYVYLIQVTDAVFASTVSYLMPIIAILWGLKDEETFSFYHIIGMLFILIGVYFASLKKTISLPSATVPPPVDIKIAPPTYNSSKEETFV